MVDETAAHILGGSQSRMVDTGWQESACEDGAGNFDGTYSAPYALQLKAVPKDQQQALLAETRDFWIGKGYAVQPVVSPPGQNPRLHATHQGYQFTLEILPAAGEAELGGNTPCLQHEKHGG
jgi:hypothetical protein